MVVWLLVPRRTVRLEFLFVPDLTNLRRRAAIWPQPDKLIAGLNLRFNYAGFNSGCWSQFPNHVIV